MTMIMIMMGMIVMIRSNEGRSEVVCDWLIAICRIYRKLGR
jgi:hypothetical protein